MHCRLDFEQLPHGSTLSHLALRLLHSVHDILLNSGCMSEVPAMDDGIR